MIITYQYSLIRNLIFTFRGRYYILNIKQLHTHLGRHTFATLLINAGVNITTIARALGHSNTRITEKTYAKLNNETVREEILTKMTKIA